MILLLPNSEYFDIKQISQFTKLINYNMQYVDIQNQQQHQKIKYKQRYKLNIYDFYYILHNGDIKFIMYCYFRYLAIYTEFRINQLYSLYILKMKQGLLLSLWLFYIQAAVFNNNAGISTPFINPTTPVLPTAPDDQLQKTYAENIYNSGSTQPQTQKTLTCKASFGLAFDSSIKVTPFTDSFDQYIKKYRPSLMPQNAQRLQLLIPQKTRSGQTISQIISYRQKVYYQNLNKINKHNSNKTRIYNMGLNQFTVLTQNQFKNIYSVLIVPPKVLSTISLKPEKTLLQQNKKIQLPPIGKTFFKPNKWQNIVQYVDTSSKIYTPPNSYQIDGSKSLTNDIIDWRCKISSMTVYNQGACGSCYAFATLSSIFISLNINSSFSAFFSVQEILSCARNNNTLLGCKGGYLQSTLNYVINHGIGPWYMYSYNFVAQTTGADIPCNNTKINSAIYKNNKYFLKGKEIIPSGDCNRLIQILRTRAIAVAIASDGFQYYLNGTFIPSNTNINHGVTLVGYDPANGFLIRNSWGNSWGTFGYAYVTQAAGVCDYAVAPIL